MIPPEHDDEYVARMEDVLEVYQRPYDRIAPEVCRSVWNEGPEDAVLIMCSVKSDGPDHETVADFWPE